MPSLKQEPVMTLLDFLPYTPPNHPGGPYEYGTLVLAEGKAQEKIAFP